MRRVGGIISLTGIVVAIALATPFGPFDSRLALAQGRQGGGGRATTKPYTTWQSYAGGAHSSQYSALDQINKKNVAKLQVAWSYPIGGNSIFNPVVIDDVMYVPSGGALVALDAATGKELWRKDGMAPSGARGMNYWESPDRSDRRFIYLQRGAVVAVNAQNGELITSFGTEGRVDLRDAMERKSANPVGTSNPGRIFENLYIIPLPGGPNYGGPPSDVHAYDVRTGKLAWIFHVIPHEGEFGYDTWPEGHYKVGGGGHNWSEFTVDEENGIAFVGFGSPRYDFYGGDRKGNNLFANSLVAIDARTGKRIWHQQLIHHDLWDFDIPQSAKLLTIRQNGKPRQIVAQATKQGFLYVFDRRTGQPIWPIEERKVPQTDVPGEWTSPTQPFPTKPAPFAKQSFTEKDINPYLPKEAQDELRARLRSYRNEGIFTPPSFEGSVSMPGHNGGANFGTSAVDPDRGEFYVVHKSLPTVLRITLPAPPRGAGPGPGGAPAAGGGGRGAGGGRGNAIVTPEQKAELMAQAKTLVENAKGQRLEFGSPVSFMQINFPGGAMTAVAPPWSEMVKYDLNTGDIVWRIPTGVQEAPPEYNIPNNTGVQFPRNAPLVTAGGLVFLATGPERKVRAYDRDNGRELWQHSLPNGAEGMMATYQVNGRQFVVLPVAQPNGTFPATFNNAARGAGPAAPAAAAPGAVPAPGAPPAAGAAPGGQAAAGGGRQGRGGGGPQLPAAYIAFALPQ
ncbi:MAG TPA: PQQ-binding-like beta-propeller repeat protein [Vicinamibacterales bacterium]|nr:PQQ-binding-like beta-propeller repeat protein [Vicinamibacterales bacterium]